jgi:hypothetical protein
MAEPYNIWNLDAIPPYLRSFIDGYDTPEDNLLADLMVMALSRALRKQGPHV